MMSKSIRFPPGVIAINECQDYEYEYWNSDIIDAFKSFGVRKSEDIGKLSKSDLKRFAHKVYYIIHNWEWYSQDMDHRSDVRYKDGIIDPIKCLSPEIFASIQMNSY